MNLSLNNSFQIIERIQGKNLFLTKYFYRENIWTEQFYFANYFLCMYTIDIYIKTHPCIFPPISRLTGLLAPQSGALRISAYRDFQSQSLPLIAFEHLSLYTTFWNSPSRPKQIRVDQGRPKQTKADQGRPRQTKADQGRPKQTKADQGRPKQTKADQGKQVDESW